MKPVATLGFLVVLAGVLLSIPASAQDDEPIVWVAMGDSYASGEGISGTAVDEDNQQSNDDCSRANGATNARAWAVVAREALYPTGQTLFVACTGAITDHYFAQLSEAISRWPEEMDSPDVISFSFGGNNIRFADVIFNCIDLGKLWGADNIPGCDVTEQQLRQRIDMLVGHAPITPEAIASGEFDGALDLPTLLDDAANRVRPGGRIVVTGYPQLVEETARWDSLHRDLFGHCQGVKDYDVGMLRSVTGYFNQQIALAAQAADHRHLAIEIVFIDLATQVYETSEAAPDRHALCSNQPWLNGRTVGFSSGDFRWKRSFHPHQTGHTAAGQHIAAAWEPLPPGAAQLKYRVAFVYPGGGGIPSDVLNVRDGPGTSYDAVATLDASARGVSIVGDPVAVGSAEWVEITHFETTGWVNRRFLVHDVPSTDFCASPLPNVVVDEFAGALEARSDERLSSIISEVHGLSLALEGGLPHNAIRVGPRPYSEGTNINLYFDEDVSIVATFAEYANPLILDVLSGAKSQSCNSHVDGPSVNILGLGVFDSINYLSFHRPESQDGLADWATVIIGFDGDGRGEWKVVSVLILDSWSY